MVLEEINNTDVNYSTSRYRDISNNILGKRMLWDEGEEVHFYEQIIPNLNEFARDRKTFLFIERSENYPVSFIGKKFGMWYALGKEHGQKFENSSEKKIELDRYCTFYGICEINQNQLELAFQLLSGGLLIFSKDDITVDNIEMFLEITNRSVTLKEIEAINYYSQKNNIVATKIIGWNGTSLNFFQKKHSW